ncbi:hypothetical protein D3C85_108810 [compost metagenome]
MRQALGRRPCQGQTVEGAGAAPDFVHQHQTALGGVVQDVGGFAHLDHEGRTATGQVIAGTDSSEDAVDQRQFATGCGHEAANVSEQHDQCGLAHVGGFTTHVRAGDHQHTGVVIQAQVVGHERRGQHLLDHRVTTLRDAHARLADEARAVQVKIQRTLGEVAQHVQFGQRAGGVLQRWQLADQVFQQGFVKHLLARQGTALGREGFVFELFQFRRDEALGAFQGLPTDIVRRCRLGLLARQFDEVAVNAVVTDFQVAKTGASFLAGFEIDEELAGVFAQ